MGERFTKADAEDLGYTFTIGKGKVDYLREGELVGTAEGDTPLFHAIANVAEREGVGFAVGYGGDEPITSELVEAVSGESYTEPE